MILLWTLKPVCSPFSMAGFHAINKVTQPAPAALFVHGLSPEITGSIKRQKIGWEATSLTELVTIAEHFERTLEQDCKQKSAKLLALQLQGQRPEATPGPPVLHLPRGPLSKLWFKDQGHSCHQQGHWKRDCPQRS